MKPTYFFILLISLGLIGCKKPIENPESLDALYQELQKEKAAAVSELAAAESEYQDHAEALTRVRPQTGQIKFASKRFFEAQKKIARVKQKIRYFEIKIESRRREARIEYLQAFLNGEEWPNNKAMARYSEQRLLTAKSKVWSNASRVEDFKSKKGSRTPAKSE